MLLSKTNHFRTVVSSCNSDVWVSSISLGQSNLTSQHKPQPCSRVELSNLTPTQYCEVSKRGIPGKPSEYEQVHPFKVLLIYFLNMGKILHISVQVSLYIYNKSMEKGKQADNILIRFLKAQQEKDDVNICVHIFNSQIF